MTGVIEAAEEEVKMVKSTPTRRSKATFVGRRPHGHKGWTIFDTVFVMRLDDNDYPLTFATRDEARDALREETREKLLGHP